MIPTVQTTATQDVHLATGVRARILTHLHTYAELTAELKRLGEERTAVLGRIEHAFEDAGEGVALDHGVSISGYKLKVVRRIVKTLDKKLLIGMGVSVAMLEEATVSHPTKPFLKVTLPGTSNHEEE